MFKKLIIPLVAMAVIMSACASTPPAAPTRKTTVINNDLAGGSVQFRHDINEPFVFVTEFSTPDPIEYWHITEPKLVQMSAWIEGGENCEVLVEHVHADAFIMSKYSGWDGTITDSMDDKIHGGLQPGFWITETHPYEEIFSIEGHSSTMYDSWTIFYADFIAQTKTTPKPMTEENLIKYGGTTGQKFQVVWNLLVKCDGETLYHTKAVIDHFAVPISQQARPESKPTPIGNP